MAANGASVEGVRRANLGAILRLAHHEGPLSRAALTQATGLNRSTVGGLVSTLAAHGLVVERDPDPTRRVGRPSPIVAPADGVVAIAANPEVDALEVGAVALGGRVRLRVREELDHVMTPDEAADRIGRIVEAWRADELRGARVVGAGLAVPGLVRAADGVVRLAPHLGWADVDVARALEARTSLASRAGNDASVGAIAERLFGAAQGHDDVVYLNGGASGIGGGAIVQGMSIGGSSGYAGEWGQSRPSIADERDRRAPGGVLEDEVRRERLLQAAGAAPGDDQALAARILASPQAAPEIARQRRILAATLANAANALNPSIIVLGGFLAALREADDAGFDEAVRAQLLSAAAEGLEIRPAALGRDRLLIGAAELVFERLAEDPLAG